MSRKNTTETNECTTNRNSASRRKRNASNKRSNNNGRNTSDYNREYSTNDIAWYTRNPELMDSASQITYALPTGSEVYQQRSASSNPNILPGACILRTACVIPNVTKKNDPVNVSGINTFMYLRKGKSGTAPYDPTDVTMYLYGMSHVYSLINWLQRTYGLVKMYSVQNKYLPMAILGAEGWDTGLLINDIANFRYQLNLLITKVAALAVPNERYIPLFSRYAFMYSGIYSESQSIKDQMYMYTPDGFYQFAVSEAKLKYIPRERFTSPASHKITPEWVFQVANEMISELYGDSDIATLGADILNAYGEEGIIKLAYVPEDYTVAPVYDPVVLGQIKNAVICSSRAGEVVVEGGANETPYVTSHIYSDCEQDGPTAAMMRYMFGKNCHQLVYTENPKPGPADTIEFTRLKLYVEDVKQGDMTFGGTFPTQPEPLEVYSGTEIVTKMLLVRLTGSVTTNYVAHELNYSVYWIEDPNEAMDMLGCISKFNYAPMVFTYFGVTATDFRPDWNVFGQIDNYGLLPTEVLSNIHYTAQFSLFSLPMSK